MACNGCTEAVKVQCGCGRLAWGNSLGECWRCHDKSSHRPTAGLVAWTDKVTPEMIDRENDFDFSHK